ncbi:hypothetical protein MMT22_29970, partial [Escherichia coli]|nr:hypothetical protein [Escherichia coli]
YGEFLNEQPELKRLAEQLGRSREAKSIPRNDAQMETFRTMVRKVSICASLRGIDLASRERPSCSARRFSSGCSLRNSPY